MDVPVLLNHASSMLASAAKGAPLRAGSLRPPLYSHVRVLEGGGGWDERQPGHGFDWRVGKVQLESFAFTWKQKER